MDFLLLLLFSLTLASSTDHRCTIDPNGSGCVGGLSASTDGRSILDPIGGTATTDRGAGLDPDGRDSGVTIDPEG